MPFYVSTRGGCGGVTAAEAICAGIAPDGGLFAPDRLVPFSEGDIASMRSLSYAELSARVLHRFLSDWDMELLTRLCGEAYASFPSGDVAPLAPIKRGLWAMELYHGPTLAFKDVALQLLPRLMAESASRLHVRDELCVLTATSGDTGKAALAGFSDVPGTRVCVYYPKGGTSEAQMLQMATQRGSNAHVIAVEGDFDDAQTGVKRLFADEALRSELAGRGIRLTSANSINLGRLAPQVAYYFSAYLRLLDLGALRMGDPLVFCVPSGNFGDILAGYYARALGLPVGRLICASNANNVLTDFFRTGVYNADRPLYKTASPSMDILVSSNLERLLFDASGCDSERVRGWMRGLTGAGRRFEVDAVLRETLKTLFAAGWTGERDASGAIVRSFDNYGYLCDPHTAVGLDVYERYAAEAGDGRPAVLLSTASPFKFATAVYGALAPDDTAGKDDFACAEALSRKAGQPVPRAISELRTLPILHKAVCAPAGMRSALLSALG